MIFFFRIRISERLKEICGNIYNNRLKETHSDSANENAKLSQLYIDIESKNKKTIIKVKLIRA